MIPFDRAEPRVPYEERRVEDRGSVRRFRSPGGRAHGPAAGRAAAEVVLALGLGAIAGDRPPGASLAQARHFLEGRWGLNTLEVPQSWLCETESFEWFAAHLLAHLPRLREVHNEALREYRQRP